MLRQPSSTTGKRVGVVLTRVQGGIHVYVSILARVRRLSKYSPPGKGSAHHSRPLLSEAYLIIVHLHNRDNVLGAQPPVWAKLAIHREVELGGD